MITATVDGRDYTVAATTVAFTRPDQIANLVLWLQADGLVLNDNDPVATWADASGAGNGVTQSTTSKKPTFKTVILNGKPIVRFDGIDDEMVLAGHIDASVCTVFVVGNKTGGVTNYLTIVCLDNLLFLYRTGTQDQWGAFEGSDPCPVVSGITLDSTFRVLSLVQRTATNVDLVTNGILVNNTLGSSLPGSNTPNAVGSHGGNQYCQGDLAEVVVYSRALTTGERIQIERYLGNKYAITVP
jgi:hypothetical protein